MILTIILFCLLCLCCIVMGTAIVVIERNQNVHKVLKWNKVFDYSAYGVVIVGTLGVLNVLLF